MKLVAFSFAIATMASCKNEDSAPQQQQQEQAKNDSLTKANDTLQSQVNAARVQIDEYMTKASKLEELIKIKDAEIAKLNKQKEELMRANKKLVSELKANKKLISSLRDELSDTSRSYADRLGMLEHDKNDLIRQRDSLIASYNRVVALGSVLHASNIRITAINLKRNGTKEKDVVLQIALKLRDRINATTVKGSPMRAYLTRDADYFVPLHVRVQKARKVQADLFVSVHADAFFTPAAIDLIIV